MNGAQGGLLMILAAVVLFVLWTRGYLSKWTGEVVASLSGTSSGAGLFGGYLTGYQSGPGAETPTTTTKPGGPGPETK